MIMQSEIFNKKDILDFLTEHKEELEYLKQQLNKPVDIGYLDSFRGFYREKIEKEVIYV